MKNDEELKLNEQFAYLKETQILSTYIPNLLPKKNGCFFAIDGKLHFLNTFWRQKDNQVSSIIHQYEIEMAMREDSVVADGIAALVLIYCLLDQETESPNAALNKDFLRFLYYQIDEHVDYLLEWCDVLVFFEFGTDDVETYTKIPIEYRQVINRASEYIKACYYRVEGFVTLSEAEQNSISVRAYIKNHKDPLIVETHIPDENCIDYYCDVDLFPLTHILIEDFDLWMYHNSNGYSCCNILGFSAYIYAKAIIQNKRRIKRQEEILNDEDEWEDNIDDETSHKTEAGRMDFCSFDVVHDIFEHADLDVDIEEDDVKICSLKDLLFTIDAKKKELFDKYLIINCPVWKSVMGKMPIFPEVLVQDGTSFYSFMLLVEHLALEFSKHSDLWQTLVPEQQKNLQDYAIGFMSYLRREFHADETKINQILEEEGLSISDLISDLAYKKHEEDAEKSSKPATEIKTSSIVISQTPPSIKPTDIPDDCSKAVAKVFTKEMRKGDKVLNSITQFKNATPKINVTQPVNLAFLMAIGKETNCIKMDAGEIDFVKSLIGIGLLPFVNEDDIKKKADGMRHKKDDVKKTHTQWSTKDRPIGDLLYQEILKSD